MRGPAIIGAGARLSDCYIGPYTAIGEDCVIERAEVEHSILLAGSTRASASTGAWSPRCSGATCASAASDRQPRAYRFMVGDNSEIGIL